MPELKYITIVKDIQQKKTARRQIKRRECS